MPVAEKPDNQKIGATMTYGRRYGLSAMVGIAQYDDDSNSTVQKIINQSVKTGDK